MNDVIKTFLDCCREMSGKPSSAWFTMCPETWHMLQTQEMKKFNAAAYAVRNSGLQLEAEKALEEAGLADEFKNEIL